MALSHDEASYLLQSEIFASGRWAEPAPPLPEFFEQYHVLVEPVRASKYPPGNALLLAPGAALGAPFLGSLGLAGIAGACVFLLPRRFAGPWIGLASWFLWTTAPGTLRFLPGYFSQNATLAAWLVGWWGLSRWRDGRGDRWLALFAAAAAWGFVTRPFTMLPYLATGALAVLAAARRRRVGRALFLAAIPAIAILSLLPIWSRATTGSAGTDPYRLWARTYLPVDRPGFGLPDAIAPARDLPLDMRRSAAQYVAEHAAYRPSAVPDAAVRRAGKVARDAWGGWRLPLVAFFAVGLFVAGPPAWFALGTSLLLLAAHLAYAHTPEWSVYYVEAGPALAWTTAAGLGAVASRLGRRLRKPSAAPAVAAVGLVLVAIGPATADVAAARVQVASWSRYHRAFEDLLSRIPEDRSLVFVRYAPGHVSDMALVRNAADLDRARTWVVWDRGADDARLVARAPGRAPYVFDERTGTLSPWASPSGEPAH